ncbi:hypothetical protein CON47_29565 [Bacillus thuringiensis]|nr:hypothetical protein CON47_29565 [Bacillus thuringiensis]PED76884.1 hypothetical protein CON88_15945 [Bacillus toyonensis]
MLSQSHLVLLNPFPANSSIVLRLKSNSGRRSVAFVLDNHQQGKKETKGTSGSGDHKVQLETSSRSISLK